MSATAVAVALDVSPQARAREEAEVKRWQARIEAARKFDEKARAQYVIDRRYARGDSGFRVDANVVGTNIDILTSFLYASDPDLDVRPAREVQVDTGVLRDAASMNAQPPAPALQAIEAEAQAAIRQGVSPEDARAAAQAAERFVRLRAVDQAVGEILRKRRENAATRRAFAETLEIVIARTWTDAALERVATRAVRAALTVAVGAFEGAWVERSEPSPEIQREIDDRVATVERIRATQAAVASGDVSEDSAEMAECLREIASLRAQPGQVVERGFVIEFIQAEDLQVQPGYDYEDYLNAQWIARRIVRLAFDACADFSLSAEDMARATRFRPRRPEGVAADSPGQAVVPSASDADRFASAERVASWDHADDGEWVEVWEVWDRSTGTVFTMLTGLDTHWVKAPWKPRRTLRFYPFFLYLLSPVDGERHPQSLVQRSAKLVDEYNSIGSDESKHRKRAIPKTAFNAGMLSTENAKKLERASHGEMVGVELTEPATPLANVLMPVAYPPMDPGLYDRRRIIQEIERIWGVQEALAGAVNVVKTATEAQIQQVGFNSRNGQRRDQLEGLLSELAEYTAEVVRAHMDRADVEALAGTAAVWPKPDENEVLRGLLQVQVRAGSSGKPDTRADAQSWSALLPILQDAIERIAQLRNSDPKDVANCVERLVQLTIERTGNRLDASTLVPEAGKDAPPPLPPPAATPPGTPSPLPPPVPGPATPPAPPLADSTRRLPNVTRPVA